MSQKNKIYTLAEAIKAAINSNLAILHTTLIGRIEKYDSDKQTADIQPLVKHKKIDGSTETLPILPEVPILHLRSNRSSKTYIHFPVKKDDYALVIFCERSLDKVILSGKIEDPEDFRRHSLSDGIAIPFNPIQGDKLSVNNADDLEVVHGDSRFSLKESGKFELTNGSVELISLISQIADTCSKITTATAMGVQPVLNKSDFTSLKSDVDKLKV
jgi:hypothetical protein